MCARAKRLFDVYFLGGRFICRIQDSKIGAKTKAEGYDATGRQCGRKKGGMRRVRGKAWDGEVREREGFPFEWHVSPLKQKLVRGGRYSSSCG